MIRPIVLTLVLATFGIGTQAQNSVPHNHTAVASSNVIDGSKNPELIPDSTAFRLYLLSISLPQNPTEDDRKTQMAHLSKAKLPLKDLQPMLTVLAEFRFQYEAWRKRWDAEATVRGEKFEPAPFLQQREELVQSTRYMLKRALSDEGMLGLNNHVQSEKRNMVAATD